MKWLRISFRELFLLVAIFALGLGWWVDHYRRLEQNKFYQDAVMWRTRARSLYEYAIVISQPGTEIEFNSDNKAIITRYASNKRASRTPPW